MPSKMSDEDVQETTVYICSCFAQFRCPIQITQTLKMLGEHHNSNVDNLLPVILQQFAAEVFENSSESLRMGIDDMYKRTDDVLQASLCLLEFDVPRVTFNAPIVALATRLNNTILVKRDNGVFTDVVNWVTPIITVRPDKSVFVDDCAVPGVLAHLWCRINLLE